MIGVLNERAKGFLRHWRKKRIKTWQLVLILVIAAILSATFLRQNNLKMVELRNEVIQADEQNGDIANALKNLNEHVFKHMNTKISQPIELVNSYNRQTEKIIKNSSQQVPNRDLYAEAARHCANQGGLFSNTRNTCFTNYIERESKKAGFGELPKIDLPDKSRFVYSFTSPLWTPDLAGFSILLTVVILIWLLIRLIEFIAVKLILRSRLRRGF